MSVVATENGLPPSGQHLRRDRPNGLTPAAPPLARRRRVVTACERSSNVICLDVLRAIKREPASAAGEYSEYPAVSTRSTRL